MNNLDIIKKYIHLYYNFPSCRLFIFETEAFNMIHNAIVEHTSPLSLCSEIVAFDTFLTVHDCLDFIEKSPSHICFLNIKNKLSDQDLSFLNMNRENIFKKNFLLFIISDDLNINLLQAQSPDLFSWRSGSVFS